MTSLQRQWHFAATSLLVGLFCFFPASGQAQTAPVTLDAGKFARAQTADPAHVARIRAAGNLAGRQKPDDWHGGGGWVEYDFEAPASGWYELFTLPAVSDHEVVVDGSSSQYVGWGDNGGAEGQPGKAGNFYLTAGKHRVRVQRWHWTGFSPIRSLQFRPAQNGSPAATCRVSVVGMRAVLRRGDPLLLHVESGARPDPATLDVLASRQQSDGSFAPPRPAASVRLTAQSSVGSQTVPVPLPDPGVYRITFASGGAPIATADLNLPQAVVVDTSPPAGVLPKETLIAQVDCVTTPPHYAGGGETQIVQAQAGAYRESGDHGYLSWQHSEPSEISFFGYRFAVPQTQALYRFEIEYPDDRNRTMLYAIRQASGDGYVTAAGPDTGGEFPLTGKMQTYSLLFWAQSQDLRLLVMPPRNAPAAAAKIRLWQLSGELPSAPPAPGTRSFFNYYEEGSNYLGFYGAPDTSPRGMLIAADRWARTQSYGGADILWPTVSVYQMAMYPSAYNTDFIGPGTFDHVTLLLLTAQRYQMGLIPEFHPEARDLYRAPWIDSPTGDIRAGGRVNAAVSRNGEYGRFERNPPFSPLHPVNRKWYLGLVGEFADRYKGYPALRGISLRLMEWADPGLLAFHSLDWGYDDYTIGEWERETGIKTPGEGAERFAARAAFLTAEPMRERWIAWRCEKVSQIVRQMRDRIRQARPDLKLYLPNFATRNGISLGREAGIDADLLGKMDGVVLVNAAHAYGRRETDRENQRVRDMLIVPEQLNRFRLRGAPGAFLFGSAYFEGTEVVVPPSAIGFPKDTKQGWISGVATPSGAAATERYALALAETDAQMLGDGGNAYTIGPASVRRWMQTYRRLPAVPFRPRKDALDPVAVWEGTSGGQRFFYAVNRDGYPAQVTVRLANRGAFPPLVRLSDGKTVAAPNGLLKLTVPAFGLEAFRAPASARIVGVKTAASGDATARVRARVAWAENLLSAAQAGKAPLDASDRDDVLAPAVRDARAALSQGHLWRARTRLESLPLIERVYEKVNAYPPDFVRP